MQNNQLNCPVDFIPINENKARITAALVMVLMIIYLFTNWWPIMAFLLYDFSLRASKSPHLSLLGRISNIIIHLLNIPNKPVDRAPKRFAAGVGFVITLSIAVLIGFELFSIVNILACVLIFFAFLESALGICAGCYIYTHGKKLF